MERRRSGDGLRCGRKVTVPSVWILPWILLSLCGCASLWNQCAPKGTRLEIVAVEKCGPSYRTEYNADRGFVIIRKQEKESALNPNPALRFFVYDVKRAAVVFEDSLGAARVSWINSRQIEVAVVPGAVRSGRAEEIPGYRFDVETGVKSSMSGNRRSGE
jgi:hypothetical protein